MREFTCICPWPLCKTQLVFLPAHDGSVVSVDMESLSPDDMKAFEEERPLLYRPGDHTPHWLSCNCKRKETNEPPSSKRSKIAKAKRKALGKAKPPHPPSLFDEEKP